MRLLRLLSVALFHLASARLLQQQGVRGVRRRAESDGTPSSLLVPVASNESASVIGLDRQGSLSIASELAAVLSEGLDASLEGDEDFPPMIGHERKLVGKLQFFLHGFHVDDVGIYLSTKSSMWGADVTPEDFLERFPGYLTVRYRIESPFLTRNNWKKGIIGVSYKRQLKLAGCPHISKEITQMKALIDEGPKFEVGSLLDFDLDEDGETYFFEGKRVNKRGDRCACVASMYAIVGKEPLDDAFKKAIFKTLRTGKATLIIAHTGHGGLIWGVAAGVLVALVFACTALICYCRGGSLRSCCAK